MRLREEFYEQDEFDTDYAFRVNAASPEEALQVILYLSVDSRNIDRLITFQQDPIVLTGGTGTWSHINPSAITRTQSEMENWGHYWITCTIHVEAENEDHAKEIYTDYFGTPDFRKFGKIIFRSIKTPDFQLLLASSIVNLDELERKVLNGDLPTNSYLESERTRQVARRDDLFQRSGGRGFSR